MVQEAGDGTCHCHLFVLHAGLFAWRLYCRPSPCRVDMNGARLLGSRWWLGPSAYPSFRGLAEFMACWVHTLACVLRPLCCPATSKLSCLAPALLFGLGACMGSAGVLPSLVEAGYGIQASTSIAIVGPKILGAPCVRAGVALQLCCCGTGSQPGTLKSRSPRPRNHRHQPNWAAPWQVSSCTREGMEVVDFCLCVRVCG